MDLTARIFEGRFPDGLLTFETINEICLKNIEKQFPIDEFETKLLKCTTVLDRVDFVRQFYKWVPFDQAVLNEPRKTFETSQALREFANSHFKKQQLPQALHGYNLAVMFAPSQSESLGKALANRSAVLLAMEKLEECEDDISLAMSTSHPTSLRQKLEARLAKVRNQIQVQPHGSVMDEQTRRRKFSSGILFKVKKPSVHLNCAEEFVKQEEDPVSGRKLVVTRDVPAGTVLIVEQPFVSVLSNSLKWNTENCHYCLKKIVRGIPCAKCSFVLYCDEDCLHKAKMDFHDVECNTLSHLYNSCTPRYMLLAFRTVVKLGVRKIHAIWGPITSNHDGGKSLESTTDDTSFKEYFPIQSLISHSDKLSAMELYSNTLCALSLISALDTYSDFFREPSLKEMNREELMRCAAATLLLHLENYPCNSISLDNVVGLETLSLADSMTQLSPDQVKCIVRKMNYQQFAAGVYGTCSLMNHSCDPNVTRINGTAFGTIAVVATRGLMTGEEICTCYSKCFSNDQLAERLTYLEENYHFKCNCIACRFDWPQLSDPRMQNVIYTCAKCSSKFKREDKNSTSDYKKCILWTRPQSKCGLCGTSYNLKDLEFELEKKLQVLFQACHLITSNLPIDGIRLLFSISKYFENAICPPFSKSSMLQDVLKHALELIVYYS